MVADGRPTIRSRAEHAFNQYLDQLFDGASPVAAEFVASQPPEIQAELQSMLDHYEYLRARLGRSPKPASSHRELGDFRLLHELGRGGMGLVWEAEQISLKRRVAVKLLAPELSQSPARLARFRREAEAGARLSHCGIVTVHSIGEHAGTHYIVEELVPGGYTLADLLAKLREAPDLTAGYYRHQADLIAQVADALETAHEAGIVHRDVKPSNILLDEMGRPRVTDFGLARVNDLPAITRTGDQAGTPYYMSPEQASRRGDAEVDPRSDVFSLGVTLYECITLVRPFEGESSRQVMDGILRAEPLDPRRHRRQVPVELAAICLKSLEKHPGRRYQSMRDLAADLRQFLAGGTVLARPPHALRRMATWVRQRRRTVAVAAAVILISMIGWLWRQNVDRSERLHDLSRLVLTALGQLNPLMEQGSRSDSTGEIEHFLASSKSDSDWTTGLRVVFGVTLWSSGRYQEAETVLTRALETCRRLLEKDDPAIVAAATNLGGILIELDRSEEAERLVHSLLDGSGSRRPVDDTTKALLLSHLASAGSSRGKHREALELHRQALELRRARFGDRHPATLASCTAMAIEEYELERLPEAERLLQDTLPIQARVLGPAHRHTLKSKLALALVDDAMGKDEDAERLYHQAVDGYRSTLPEDHPDTLAAIKCWAGFCVERGRLDGLEPQLDSARLVATRSLGEKHSTTIGLTHNLAYLYFRQGRLDEAAPMFRRVLAQQLEVGQERNSLITMRNLGALLEEQGRMEEAQHIKEQAYETSVRLLGEEHLETLSQLNNLAISRQAMGDLEEAERDLERVVECRRRRLGERHPATLNARTNLARVYREDERFEDAEKILRDLVRLAPQDPDHHNELALLLVKKPGVTRLEAEEAIAEARKALALSGGGPSAHLHDTLAWSLLAAGRGDEAVAEEELAVSQAPDQRKPEFRAYLAEMRSRVEQLKAATNR